MPKKTPDSDKKPKKATKRAIKATGPASPTGTVLPPLPILVPASGNGETPAAPSAPSRVKAEKPKAEKPKVLKRTPKPRIPRAPKEIVISYDDIALRAYYIAERRQALGWPGDSTSDWVEAERQLRAEALKKK